MTVWSPIQVAGFARNAGFDGDPLVLAVAVALAASNGDDSVRHEVPAAGAAEWRGLWLVRTSLVDGDPGGRLYDPRVSAEVVRRLSGASQADWAWSEVYRAGAWRAQLDAAGAAVRGEDDGSAGVGIAGIAAHPLPLGVIRGTLATIIAGQNALHHL